LSEEETIPEKYARIVQMLEEHIARQVNELERRVRQYIDEKYEKLIEELQITFSIFLTSIMTVDLKTRMPKASSPVEIKEEILPLLRGWLPWLESSQKWILD